MGSSKPRLSEAWLENSQKSTIEKRVIDYNGKTREDWRTLTVIEYKSNSITTTEMYSKQFERGQKPVMKILFDYDKNLKKIKAKVYSLSGDKIKDPIMYTNYIYDTADNLIKIITTSLVDFMGNPTVPKISTTEYRYKDTFLIEEWKVAMDTSIFEHYSYKYDTTGSKVEKKLLDKIDKLEQQLYTWKYDSSGKVIEDNTFFNDGKIFRRHKFIYNERGDLVEQLEYGDESDNEMVKVTYKYD